MMQAVLKKNVSDRIQSLAEVVDRLYSLDSSERTEVIDLFVLGSILLHAQTILFPAEQAQVFAELSREYGDSLDYALPFEQVLIEFMAPVTVDGRQLLGIALSEDVFNAEGVRAGVAGMGASMPPIPTTLLPDGAELHTAIAIYPDDTTRITWRVDNRTVLFDQDATEAATIKNLAIAVIGYINCENVVLSRQEVSPKVNRKRAAKGKRPLEPFYLCRLHGVRYEAGEGEGSGRHVSFRFDVRGHFRRLPSGRTTWVRAHQRGLDHELYKPKTYKVD